MCCGYQGCRLLLPKKLASVSNQRRALWVGGSQQARDMVTRVCMQQPHVAPSWQLHAGAHTTSEAWQLPGATAPGTVGMLQALRKEAANQWQR